MDVMKGGRRQEGAAEPGWEGGEKRENGMNFPASPRRRAKQRRAPLRSRTRPA